MRIALAGTGKLGTLLMHPLLNSPKHQVVAVLQNGRRTKGIRRWTDPFMGQFTGNYVSVGGVARRHGIPNIFIDKMTEEELVPLKRLEPDLLLVGGFAIILKTPLLRLPKLGCLNCHSALLPEHRGPNPFSAVILANESETGVTFHAMDEGIDTGPIIAQYRMAVEPSDTAGSLYHRSSELAGQKILEVLDQIEAEGLSGEPQDPEAGSYDAMLQADDMFIDWSQDAQAIDRLIRAGHPFKLARFHYNGHQVFITRATFDPAPVDHPPGTVIRAARGVVIATGKGTVRLLVAMSRWPIPWMWPSIFNCPRVGDIVE